MIKIAILLMAITISLSKLGKRWIPAEITKAFNMLTWLLGGYIVILLVLELSVHLRPAG